MRCGFKALGRGAIGICSCTGRCAARASEKCTVRSLTALSPGATLHRGGRALAGARGLQALPVLFQALGGGLDQGRAAWRLWRVRR
jgi:hypothetical protein